MGFLIDLIVLLALAYFLMRGYKKGFVISIVDTFSCIFAFIITMCTYKLVVPHLAASAIGTFISEKIEGIILGIFAKEATAIVDQLSIQSVLKANISPDALISDAALNIAQNITSALITILTVILLFIVIRILLKLLKKPIKTLASIPVIKQIDTVLGVITGIIAGFFWVYVIMAVVGLLSFVPAVATIADLVKSSSVASILYNNNLLLLMIG